MKGLSLDDQVALVVRRLTDSIDLPEAAIELEVRDAFGRWNEATVRDFLPIVVERHVRQRLLSRV